MKNAQNITLSLTTSSYEGMREWSGREKGRERKERNEEKKKEEEKETLRTIDIFI